MRSPIPALAPAAGTIELVGLPAQADLNGFHAGASADGLGFALDENQPWTLRLRKAQGTFEGFTEDELPEAYLVVEYTAS